VITRPCAGAASSLATDIPGTSYVVVASTMLSGGQVLIKVVATDGLLAGEDASNAVFTIARHAPEARIIITRGR